MSQPQAAREVATVGDTVQHDYSHEVGVVVATRRNTLLVQTTPGETRVWYRRSVTIV
jgi:hypothetical protein